MDNEHVGLYFDWLAQKQDSGRSTTKGLLKYHQILTSQAVFTPLGVQKNVQYTQESHCIHVCTIWVDIGRLWTPRHPLEQTVLARWGVMVLGCEMSN